jgi:hypothetical protein
MMMMMMMMTIHLCDDFSIIGKSLKPRSNYLIGSTEFKDMVGWHFPRVSAFFFSAKFPREPVFSHSFGKPVKC